MNVVEALNSRFTCRAYKQIPVERVTLEKVLAAATRAPSWGNTQPWEIFVAQGATLDRLRQAYQENLMKQIPMSPDLGMVESWPDPLKIRYQEVTKMMLENAGIDRDDRKGRMLQAARGFNFFGATTVAFLCMDRSLNQWSLFDLGLVAQSILLAAEHYGLNTSVAVQMVAFPDLIREELSIPENFSVVIGIGLGYGDLDHIDNRPRASRRALGDVVRFKED